MYKQEMDLSPLILGYQCHIADWRKLLPTGPTHSGRLLQANKAVNIFCFIKYIYPNIFRNYITFTII